MKKMFMIRFPDKPLYADGASGKGPALQAMIMAATEFIQANIKAVEVDDSGAPAEEALAETVPVEVVRIDEDDEDYRPPSRVVVHRR